MKKLYEKNELTFAIILIIAYVVLCSIGDSVSGTLGITKIITAPICLLMTFVIYTFIKNNNLKEKVGLVKFNEDKKKYLYFAPLVLLATTNIWFGLTLNMSVAESVLYVISMLCVGFIEEILFRGFLFKAMAKDNLKSAIIISSLTFGLGHIINLLNGKEIASTLMQMCYAFAIGYLFTIIFHKSKSLWPCIITHSVINSLSTFANRSAINPTSNFIAAMFLFVVSLLYALYILKNTKTQMSV